MKYYLSIILMRKVEFDFFYSVVFFKQVTVFFFLCINHSEILIKTTDISSCWQDPSFLFYDFSLITYHVGFLNRSLCF